jgi:hypothetical protein
MFEGQVSETMSTRSTTISLLLRFAPELFDPPAVLELILPLVPVLEPEVLPAVPAAVPLVPPVEPEAEALVEGCSVP